MYITFQKFQTTYKIMLRLHFYENYCTLAKLYFSVKNLTFYIVVGYFLFYISFYLNQVDLTFMLSTSYYLTLTLHHSSFIISFIFYNFSYLYDLKSLFYVYYIKNFKNKNISNLHFYQNYFTLPYILFQKLKLFNSSFL